MAAAMAVGSRPRVTRLHTHPIHGVRPRDGAGPQPVGREEGFALRDSSRIREMWWRFLTWPPDVANRHVGSVPRLAESSFLTVVMAAIFALSLVPTGAWADTVGETGTKTQGVLGTAKYYVVTPKAAFENNFIVI